jgi:hypothetical protein
MATANDGGDADDKGKEGAGSADDKGKGKSGGEGGEGSGKDKGAGGGEKTYTRAEVDAELAADRQARKRAEAAKASGTSKGKKKDADDDGEAPEVAEARKRAEAAEAQLRVRDARDAVESAAKTAGFQNPRKIYRLIKDDLSFDDAGKPDNVKDLITIAKRDFPEELGSKGNGSADGGAGGGGGERAASTSMNDFIRRAAGRG